MAMNFGTHIPTSPIRWLLCKKCQNCKYLRIQKILPMTMHGSSIRLMCDNINSTSATPSTHTKPNAIHSLCTRNLIQLKGPDVKTFLQGMVTNDVNSLRKGCGLMYAMMLNVQGRVMYDLMLYDISREPENFHLLMECDAKIIGELVQTLKRYKIRKKVDIADVSGEYQILSALGSGTNSIDSLSHNNHVIFNGEDPRVPMFGRRIVIKSSGTLDLGDCEDLGEAAYHENRYIWGIAEGIADLPPGNCFPLESNADYMNGVSFSKGCYIGQELTARTYHTGVIRKRLLPIVFDRVPDAIPAGQNVITTETGKNIGKFRHSEGKQGLALIRLAEIKEELQISGQSGETYTVNPTLPEWWTKPS